MTVVDDLSGASGAGLHSDAFINTNAADFYEGDLETIVLKLVKDDPFATISEIRREIWRHSDMHRPSWWRVFGVLRRHGLVKKRSRFRFARGHR